MQRTNESFCRSPSFFLWKRFHLIHAIKYSRRRRSLRMIIADNRILLLTFFRSSLSLCPPRKHLMLMRNVLLLPVLLLVKPNFRESETKEKWKCFLSTLKHSFVDAVVAWMELHWYRCYHLRQLVNEKRLICWFFTTTQRYCLHLILRLGEISI